jgi:hypothetical protein
MEQLILTMNYSNFIPVDPIVRAIHDMVVVARIIKK